MSPMIQIRNVPEEVHRTAKARAALQGMTLSDFALRALEEAVGRRTVGEIDARIRLLEPVADAPPAPELVRADPHLRPQDPCGPGSPGPHHPSRLRGTRS